MGAGSLRLRTPALFFFRTTPFLSASTAVFGCSVDRAFGYLEVPLLLSSRPNLLPAAVAAGKRLVAIEFTLPVTCRRLLRRVSRNIASANFASQVPSGFFPLSAFPRRTHVRSSACGGGSAWAK